MYKPLHNTSLSAWKRKRLLFLIISMCIAPVKMLANYKIESSNYILKVASEGRLLLQDKQSETLVQLGELKFDKWPQPKLANNCEYEITEVDGASTIRIHYFFPSPVPASMKLTGTFTVHQDRVDVQYLLSGFLKNIILIGEDASSVFAYPKMPVLRNCRKPNWVYGNEMPKEDSH